MKLAEKFFQRNDKIFIQFYFLIVSLSFYICSAYSYYLRQGTFNLPDGYVQGSGLIVVTFFVLGLLKSRDNRYIIGTAQFFKIELIILIQTFVICIILTVIFKVTDTYSRIWLFSTFILCFFSLIFFKVLFDLFYRYLISSNAIQRNILIVGDTFSCKNIIKKFPKKISNSVIKCLITIDDDATDTNFYGVPKFNLKDDINYVFNHHAIGQIWIVSSIKTQVHIEKLIDQFMQYSVDCRLISPESKFKFIEGLDSEAGFDFYNVSFSPFYGTDFFIKNLIDRLLSLFFLIIALPIILISSFLIILTDGFPIFFKQKRTGWDGRSFNIYKLRSLSKSSTKTESQQVKSGDKRVTLIGKIIRRLSIDELPQLFNVLKGDMSIVGPRPHMLEHTKFYSKEILNFMQRHKCLPGLTGWAQVNGARGPTDTKEAMDKRFQYDLYYIKNWNLMLDIYIIVRTFFVILFQKVD